MGVGGKDSRYCGTELHTAACNRPAHPTLVCVCLDGAIHIDVKRLLEDWTKLFVLLFSVGVLLFWQPSIRHQSMSNAFSIICCACTLPVCSPLATVRTCHLHVDIWVSTSVLCTYCMLPMPCIVVTPGCPFSIHSSLSASLSLSLSLSSYFSVSLPLSCLLRASVRVCVDVRECVSVCVSFSLFCNTFIGTRHPPRPTPYFKTIGGHSLPQSAAGKLKIGVRQRPWVSADFVCLRVHRYRTMTSPDLTPGLAPSQHPCMQPHFTPTSSSPDIEQFWTRVIPFQLSVM